MKSSAASLTACVSWIVFAAGSLPLPAAADSISVILNDPNRPQRFTVTVLTIDTATNLMTAKFVEAGSGRTIEQKINLDRITVLYFDNDERCAILPVFQSNVTEARATGLSWAALRSRVIVDANAYKAHVDGIKPPAPSLLDTGPGAYVLGTIGSYDATMGEFMLKLKQRGNLPPRDLKNVPKSVVTGFDRVSR